MTASPGLLLLAGYVILNSIAVILLRSALRGADGGAMDALRAAAGDPRLWLGGSFYVVSFLMWVAMLSMYDVARIYPLALGLGYAATVVLAALVLHEHVSGMQIAGIVLIGTGLVALVVR